MEQGKGEGSTETAKPDPRVETDNILKRRKVDGNIIFAMIAGSAAYNLRKEDGGSDYDFLAVYCAPPTQFWGLHQPQPRVTSKPGQSPDIQVVEAAAFCNALLNANPTFVEMLWVQA
jgi:predicted nucleotidyltransferase